MIIIYFKNNRFRSYIINVGNIRVGGTGKTPLIDFLVQKFTLQKKVGLVSKGYKRKSKGTIIANLNLHTVDDIGDESFFLMQKNANLDCVISSQRIEGIEILQEKQNDIIILDDAFHHREIFFDKNILLTDFKNMFYRDMVLPTGNLREYPQAYKRADIILVTKCPFTLSVVEAKHIINKINLHRISIFFFSSLAYKDLSHLFNLKFLYPRQNYNVIALHGIAQSSYFIDYLQSKFNIVLNFDFADHYNYQPQDIKFIIAEYKKYKNCIIITTEKDGVKLKQFKNILQHIEIYILPISIDILFNEETKFLQKNYLKN